MTTQYKFRAWDEQNKVMHTNFQFIQSGEEGNDWICFTSDQSPWPADAKGILLNNPYFSQQLKKMMFSGFKDRSGKEIYAGDRISIRSPYRTTQTHTGANIPNGSYAEPMEPGIKTEEYEVVFQDGMFAGKNLDIKENLMPLAWLIEQHDEESIQSAIWCRSCGFWDDPEEGDLQYLLQEYKLKDLAALIEYVSGCEITGNIYEDAEA